jgi:hypothetical protein
MKTTTFINSSKSNIKSRILSISIVLFLFITSFSSLHSQSPSKGVLLPSMSLRQRDAILKPEEGTIIYNKDSKKPQYYNGSSWKFFDQGYHYIGEEFEGGIIFFIDPSGDHGLICATSDQSTSEWGFFEVQVGASGKEVGSGKANTEKIINKSPDPNIAAHICSDLISNGFNDWYLPSFEELNLVYKNLSVKKTLDFVNENFWTSSETDFNNAWLINLVTGHPTEGNVKLKARVRAIRSF